MKLWAISIPRYAVQLSEHFWPGPMTLIVKRSLLAKDFLTGGQNCIGLRVPAHPIALDFLTAAEKVGCEGVAAPSANVFGAVSPTNAEAVLEEIGSELNQQDFILDGGECMHGIESTIIECTGLIPKILRPGFITSKAIQSAVKSPRAVNIDLVNAQQARRILDRIVGFEISPVLWRRVGANLSAGRVQSVAVKLIVEREQEINGFTTQSNFKVDAYLIAPDSEKRPLQFKAELSEKFTKNNRWTSFFS
jgi:tRNA threonylcarbamoyl adenosine modification protein (Sua5/YciO/YrdC/YwlC family)